MQDLTSRTSRRAIPAGSSLEWVRLAPGRSLGYRRLPSRKAGDWYVRARHDGRYVVRRLAKADDDAKVPADGKAVLSYAQASSRASSWSPLDEMPKVAPGALTVAAACERYLEDFDGTEGGRRQVTTALRAHVLPALGTIRLAELSVDRLRRWHRELAEKPARLRGGKVRKTVTEDQKRARRSTANRILSVLKAALNKAVADGLAEPGSWVQVKPFRRADAARVRWLDQTEIKRLLNSCDPDFRDLVSAALHTGARYSELAGLRVGDVKPEASAVWVRPAKTETGRHVYLTEEGEAFLEARTAGRRPEEWLLTRPEASRAVLERARTFDRQPTEIERERAAELAGVGDTPPWGRSEQRQRILEACKVAKLDPPVRFHELRHTYASLYVMSGGSLVSLAKQLGHTSTRMVEKHYGHLADSWRADEARKHAPKIGTKRQKVKQLRSRA